MTPGAKVSQTLMSNGVGSLALAVKQGTSLEGAVVKLVCKLDGASLKLQSFFFLGLELCRREYTIINDPPHSQPLATPRARPHKKSKLQISPVASSVRRIPRGSHIRISDGQIVVQTAPDSESTQPRSEGTPKPRTEGFVDWALGPATGPG